MPLRLQLLCVGFDKTERLLQKFEGLQSNICIIQIPVLCRLLALHAPLYTNIADCKSRTFRGKSHMLDTKKVFEQFLTFLDPRK